MPRDARAERATSPEQKSSRSFHDLTTLTIRQVIDFHSIPLYTTCNNNHFVLLLVFLLLRLLHVVVVGISATLRILHFLPQKATVPALSPAIVVSTTPPAISGHSSGTNITEIPYTTTAFNMTVLPKYEAELAYLVFQHIAEPVAERKHTLHGHPSSLTFLTYQIYRRTLQHLCSRSIQHWPKAGGTMLRCRRPLHFQTSPRNTLCPIRRRR